MTRDPDTRDDSRSLAEAAFQRYLDRYRDERASDADDFVSEAPARVREELRRMIDDYHALREQMGHVSANLEAGRVLGDFRLVREIGRGGMGVVWEARQVSLDRPVALKVLWPHFTLSSGALQRFQREARAGGRMAHPGIVQTHAIGEADGYHYIAQELVPSAYTLADSLADLRERKRLPEGYARAAAELFAKIADALQYAHEQGVIHRDVKPSNILLTERDEPRITDFGLAKIEDDLGISRTLEITGTPYYMSPEQAAAKSMGIDHRSDVFSLGTTLYEALALERPFDGETTYEVFRQILTSEPERPKTVPRDVPDQLAATCMRALRKSPDERFQSMSDFAAALRAFARGEAVHSETSASPTHTDSADEEERRPGRSLKPELVVGAAAIGILVIAGGWMLFWIFGGSFGRESLAHGNACPAIDAASRILVAVERTGELKNLARNRDLTEHEQMHLIDAVCDRPTRFPDSEADVLVALVEAQDLTPASRAHLRRWSASVARTPAWDRILTALEQPEEVARALNLPEVSLPTCSQGEPMSFADAETPVLYVLASGEITGGEEALFGPGRSGEKDFHALGWWLKKKVEPMEKEPFDPSLVDGPLVPASALLVRADAEAPFRWITEVLRAGASPGIALSRYWIAVRLSDGTEAVLPIMLPRNTAKPDGSAEPVEMVECRMLRVPEDDTLRYQVGPMVGDLEAATERLARLFEADEERPLVLDAGPDALVSEVVELLDHVRQVGYRGSYFTYHSGAPDRPMRSGLLRFPVDPSSYEFD